MQRPRAHLDSSVVVDRHAFNAIATKRIVRSGFVELWISPVALAEVFALEKPSTGGNRRLVEAFMSNGVEVYLPTREEMEAVFNYYSKLSKLAEWLGPSDIMVVSYALADLLCSYLLTVDEALLNSRGIRKLAQGRGLRVLSPGDFLR